MELHMICNSYDNKDLLSLVYKEFIQKNNKKANSQKKNG